MTRAVRMHPAFGMPYGLKAQRRAKRRVVREIGIRQFKKQLRRARELHAQGVVDGSA